MRTLPGGCLILLVSVLAACAPRQRVDTAFQPALRNAPAYDVGAGPTIWIDEAHRNVVQLRGAYRPLIDVLELDGYLVRAFRSAATTEALRDKRLLVIGNAHAASTGRPDSPPESAFSPDEIAALVAWVSDGGRLLLLVDHMPTAGAAAALARAFGFELNDGFVIDWDVWDDTIFRRDDGTLLEHPVTRGRSAAERIDVAAAFYGAAFRAPDALPILVIGPGNESFMPDEPWDIHETTPRIDAEGWLMGATRVSGKGRIALFSDASMFSAQINKGGGPMGWNSKNGEQNLQLLLNVVHWLEAER